MENAAPQTPMVPHIERAEDERSEDLMGLVAESVTDDRNWAADEEVVRRIREHLYPVIEQTRKDHIALHEEWRTVARMTALLTDSHKRYNGRSDVYIPSYVSARRTLVSQLSQGSFPSDEYVGVSARERKSANSAPNPLGVKQYVQWELEKNARIRRHLKGFLGNFVDYGYSVLKYWYEKTTKGPVKAKFKINSDGSIGKTYESTCEREGLRVSARSVYDFYVYPYNISELSEALVVFEDIPVSRAYIQERIRKKEWENGDKMLDAPDVSEASTNAQEGQDENMKAVSNQRMHAHLDLGDILTVTEVWCRLQLPDAAYMDGEEKIPVPCKIVMGGDVVAEVRRNPHDEQEPPYLVARDDPKPGSWYSKGTGYIVRGIQYLINDFSNQLNDNGTLAMNPMVLVNPATLSGPLTPFKPGGVWETTDVQNGIKFDRPPIEQIQYGMQLVQSYAAMLADHSGATPSLQGRGAGGNAKTATGMQLLQKNATTPLKDTVEDLEECVYSPLARAAWRLGQQYRDDEYIIEVMGDADLNEWLPKEQTRKELAGDYVFRWLASNQAANAQQRAMQGIQLLQVLAPPLVQLLNQNGWQVDPYELLKRVYQDAMGFRDFNKFIYRMQQPMMGPGGMPMPGQGQPPKPGNEVRSAAIQNPNGAEPEASTMAPGEDEFSALRQQVEAMTGNGVPVGPEEE